MLRTYINKFGARSKGYYKIIQNKNLKLYYSYTFKILKKQLRLLHVHKGL
jgi:hypothetical protein